ncbi:OmpA family protein [Spirosoma fluminis]
MATTTPLDHLRSVFTPSAVNELAQSLNETKANTQKAIDGLLPTVTAGVMNRVSDKDGARNLYHLLKNTPFATESNLGQLVDTNSERQKAAESGNGLLKKLYDQRVHQVAQETSKYSGIGLGSATTLTGLVASVLMGFLHKQVTSNDMTEAQLAAMLHGGAEATRSGIPAVFAVPLAWFIGTPYPAATPVVPVREEAAPAGGLLWWQWLLIALGLLLLILLLLRSCNSDNTTAEQATGSGMAAATDTVASDMDGNGSDSLTAAAPKVRVAVDAPGGRKLILTDRAFTYQLARYLASEGSRPDKSFLFDELRFETNTARLTPDAQAEVNDLAQIMKTYPKLHIRIVGYTDSVGPESINKPLSAARANFVKAALVKNGISADRITTSKEGEDEPIATNQTAKGRQRNRRVEIVVTQL